MENLPTTKELSEKQPVNAEKPKINDPRIQKTQKDIAKDIENLAFNPKKLMPDEKYDVILTADIHLSYEKIEYYLNNILRVKEYLTPAFITRIEDCLSLMRSPEGLSYEKFKELKKALSNELEFQRKKTMGEYKKPKTIQKPTSPKIVPLASIKSAQELTQPKTAQVKTAQPKTTRTIGISEDESVEERNRRIVTEYRKDRGIKTET